MPESDTPDNKIPMFKIWQNLEASKGKHKSQPTKSNFGPRGQKGKSISKLLKKPIRPRKPRNKGPDSKKTFRSKREVSPTMGRTSAGKAYIYVPLPSADEGGSREEKSLPSLTVEGLSSRGLIFV